MSGRQRTSNGRRSILLRPIPLQELPCGALIESRRALEHRQAVHAVYTVNKRKHDMVLGAFPKIVERNLGISVGAQNGLEGTGNAKAPVDKNYIRRVAVAPGRGCVGCITIGAGTVDRLAPFST